MSIEAMSWAFNDAPVKNSTTKFVLVSLANFAGPNGENVFPGVATICRYTELSERAVRQHIKALRAAGVLNPAKNPGVAAAYFKDPRHRPKAYDIDMTLTREEDMWVSEKIDEFFAAERKGKRAGHLRSVDDDQPAEPAPANNLDDDAAAGQTQGDPWGAGPWQQESAPAEETPAPEAEPVMPSPEQTSPDDSADSQDVLFGDLDGAADEAQKARLIKKLAGQIGRERYDSFDPPPIGNKKRVTAKFVSLAKAALEAGFTPEQINAALQRCSDPLPSNAAFERALRQGDPSHRSASGTVQTQNAAGAAPRFGQSSRWRTTEETG